MVQTPADVWMGKVTGVAALAHVALQLGWAAVLYVAAHGITQLATRRVVVQGG
jgi:ABC-2 type transport system permease protein